MTSTDIDKELLTSLRVWMETSAAVSSDPTSLLPLHTDGNIPVSPAVPVETISLPPTPSTSPLGSVAQFVGTPTAGVSDGSTQATSDALRGAQELTERLLAFSSQATTRDGNRLNEATAIAQNAQTLLTTPSLVNQSSNAGSETVLSSIGRVLGTTFGSGFGIFSLVSGLAHLFGSDDSTPATAIEKYSRPPSVAVQAAFVEGDRSIHSADFGAEGTSRAYPSFSPQVTIQVAAMDSRSFTDHSNEIASAVRTAMLASHPLNDMVADL
jgi:hypothetical protein